ncbi:MAG: hypothetical protein HZA92_06665 [Verrucomicrobia bacterium]|nr:hypothetical protein [Verrucomicrobiota bacterium]
MNGLAGEVLDAFNKILGAGDVEFDKNDRAPHIEITPSNFALRCESRT